MIFSLTHVQHDPAHCSCPGLFRNFMRGHGDFRLDLSYKYGDTNVQILSPYLLGASDLWVLQGLIAMAGAHGQALSLGAPKTKLGKHLALELDPTGSAINQKAIGVIASFTELAKEMGYAEPDSHSTRAALRRCIKRLYTITIFAESAAGESRGFRLLSSYSSSTKDKTFNVALNPMIAAAVAGDARYIRIPMHEVRAIKHDSTRLIHQRLCAFINEDCTHPSPIGKDTLYGYIWHDLEPSSGGLTNRKIKDVGQTIDDATRARQDHTRAQNLERSRRGCLKESIAELVALGWCFDEVAKGKYRITRAKA